MRKASFPLFALLLASAVLCAADFGHGVILTLERTGLITGSYGLYSHGATTSTLLAAFILAALGIIACVGDALIDAAGLRVDWLAYCTARVARIHLFPLASFIFLLQIALIFTIETVEQTVAFGHPLGLTAAFGAPLPLALAVHAFAALIMASSAVFLSRSIAQAARRLARAAAPHLRRLVRNANPASEIRRPSTGLRIQRRRLTPLARRIANRPPPFAISLA